MRVFYKLSNKEVKEVEFSCRFICDRQYEDVSLQNLMEDMVYVYGRMDMFWIECKLGDTDLGSMAVEPDKVDPAAFVIFQNHCKVAYPQFINLKQKAYTWFKGQPEYRQQQQWMQNIINKYFVPVGGWNEYCNRCEQVKQKWLDEKIAVAKEFEGQIKEYLTNGVGFDVLNEVFRNRNVYRIDSHCISGFDHMMWVYNNYVKEG